MEILNKKGYYIWGAGNIGALVVQYLSKYINIVAVIDSSPEKVGTNFYGLKVVNYKSVKPNIGEYGIVIAISGGNKGICILLDNDGYHENIDYCKFHEFIADYFYCKKHEMRSALVNLGITSRCTLNCKHCLQYMPYYAEQRDYDLNFLIKSVDLLFSHLDGVMMLYVMGGEPFLYPKLGDFLSYVYNRYQEKIGFIILYTNATVTPNEELLKKIKDMHIRISVTNYSKTLPNLEKATNRFLEAVKNYEIEVAITPNGDRWFDYGYPDKKPTTDEEAKIVFRDCRQAVSHLIDNKLYYCTMQGGAVLLGDENALGVSGNDYFDLSQEKTKNSDYELLNIISGEPPLGMLTFCKVCNGCSSSVLVSPAEQTPRKGENL